MYFFDVNRGIYFVIKKNFYDLFFWDFIDVGFYFFNFMFFVMVVYMIKNCIFVWFLVIIID